MLFVAVHESAVGTKRARAYATDVRSWWKLTYERSGGIRVFAAVHSVAHGIANLASFEVDH
jgi:hypothetical protein